jgi:hypothetical protein
MVTFFASSRAFHTQLTALYDLINPTAVAMWNLRRQVGEYMSEREGIEKLDLDRRFVAGSGIGSANLLRYCVEQTWDDQTGELALLGIFGAVGLYEGWIAALEIGSADQRARLQFPSKGIAGRKYLGVCDTVAVFKASDSALLERAYGPTLRASARYMPDRLDDMLVCYRCFKEIRNICAHAGRIPDDYTVTAYTNALAAVSKLGRNGKDLRLPAIVPGQPIRLSLVNIQNLCALLFSIVVTLDAELAVTKAAELALVD